MNAFTITRLGNRSGLEVQIQNGAIRRIAHGEVMINLFPGTIVEGGLTNIYLRILGENPKSTPLLVAGAQISWNGAGCTWRGEWDALTFEVRLVLAESSWFWDVAVENRGTTPVVCDLIHTQDVALAHEGAVRLNEYYVGHYVDHTPLNHPTLGAVVASRQNQSTGGRFPWLLLGSLGHAVGFATDALQFHGLQTRSGKLPEALAKGLPNARLQHEHSMVSLQEKPFTIGAHQKVSRGFFGLFEPDHAEASSQSDLAKVEQLLAPKPPAPTQGEPIYSATSLFGSVPLLEALECDEQSLGTFFSGPRLHLEHDQRLLSFFLETGAHVVLKAKELAVLRPHGHMLRTGNSLVPDESALTSTVWMNGVFHSMVTQGHVSINRLLSTCHGYLGFFRSHGQRVFVELDGHWQLLDTPSAFEIAENRCRWIYRHETGAISVTSSAMREQHLLDLEIRVLEGAAARFLITHHLALNGELREAAAPHVKIEGNTAWISASADSDVGRRFPNGGFILRMEQVERIGGDELLFADGQPHGTPFLCVMTGATSSVCLQIEGHLVEAAPAPADRLNSCLDIQSAQSPAPERLAQIFPWLVNNALVHYLCPRGLEQYSGGGWGTRDVCQGPVELLMAHGKFAPVRDILLRVFKQQNPDGDWPQWFMFFERERDIRPGDSHGDIVFWPVLALAQYLEATGDSSLLNETVPFFGSNESRSIQEHLDCALALIAKRVIPGTRLAAYGHGDWNDSLQPVQPEMRERLCSAWTVTLHYQSLRTLARAMKKIGQSKAALLESEAQEILEQFQSTLVADRVVAGLAYFRSEEPTLLLHPRDQETGLSYSLLPMIHAIINDMFSPEQAKEHLALIRAHLLGPDGARLFDRPLSYHGGRQRYFQRAESACYFGREIGLMYTHAHLRYCEALARSGQAEEFLEMLARVNPIGLRETVPAAALRQANCYYSSSDAMFPDRYAAAEEYEKAMRGEVPLEGGWRVYSSGAGIAVRLIKQCFLGLSERADALLLDPVVPGSLGGLKASVELYGAKVEIVYHAKQHGCGPEWVRLNDHPLEFQREENPYRSGGVRITGFSQLLERQINHLEIGLG